MIYKCLLIACFIIFYLIFNLPSISNSSTSARENTLSISSDLFDNSEKPHFSEKPFPSFLPEYSPTDWWNQQNKKEPQNYPIFQLSQNYQTFSQLCENYPNLLQDREKSKQNLSLEGKMPWLKEKYKQMFETKTSSETKYSSKERWNKYGKEYLLEILKYAYKNNISLDGNIENDWNPIKQETNWFHAPWLHANKKNSPKDRGREFVHGLTAERCSCVDELNGKNLCSDYSAENKEIKNNACDNYSEKIQNWGVAVFNDVGGYNVGRIWQEITVFESSTIYPNAMKFKNMDFPDGSVIVKLLFTSATDNEAKYLKGSNLVWKTDINRIRKYSKPGELEVFPTLRLLQIDIAVRDKRANDYSGWVFGTFAYNNNKDKNLSKELGDFNGWENIQPLGLMFGNDPTVTKNSIESLRESLINPEIENTQHLGCGKRLNGTVDNPKSSCIACHAQQSEVQVSKVKDGFVNFTEIQYKIGSPSCDFLKDDLEQCDLSYWFKNVRPGETFSRDTETRKYYSLHNVLQLQLGLTRYCDKFPNNCLYGEPQDKKIYEKIQNYPKMKESSRSGN